MAEITALDIANALINTGWSCCDEMQEGAETQEWCSQNCKYKECQPQCWFKFAEAHKTPSVTEITGRLLELDNFLCEYEKDEHRTATIGDIERMHRTIAKTVAMLERMGNDG